MKTQELVAVIKSLKSDATKLKALNRLLDDQYVALINRDTDLLSTINEQAMALIESVKTSQAARDRLFNEWFDGPSNTVVSEFINMLPKELRQIASPLTNEIRAFNKLCKAKNQRNGLLLSSQNELLKSVIGGNATNSYPDQLVKF
ncbi:flagellar export chaperone FlgN [Alteromonas sp. S015]|uniref:flagellar export chaperone FlgN n=1 Tax=Alteromonas sp. S015 TaxID=3117401 RepID=UPI002FE0B72B